MTAPSPIELDSLRAALTAVKRDAAKVIAEMQLGGDRTRRRALAKRLRVSARQARALLPSIEAQLASQPEMSEQRAELEQARRFVEQLQQLAARETGRG